MTSIIKPAFRMSGTRQACVLLATAAITQTMAAAAHDRTSLTQESFSNMVFGARFVKRNDVFVPIVTARNLTRTCAMLNVFQRNFLKHNPADVVVFSLGGDEDVKGLLSCTAHQLPDPANMSFVDLKQHARALGWTTPAHVQDTSLWRHTFSENFVRVGAWRLTTQFQLARLFGYRLVMYVDDDSIFPEPVTEPVFDTFYRRALKMAARVVTHDPLFPTVALPELARFFIVSEQLEPKTLYQHCRPANVSGLFSASNDNAREGWDRTIFYSNFAIISVDFYYEPMVQRFVRLAFESGGVFKHRWNEQGVLSMVWQLFVEPSKFHMYDFKYEHPPGKAQGK